MNLSLTSRDVGEGRRVAQQQQLTATVSRPPPLQEVEMLAFLFLTSLFWLSVGWALYHGDMYAKEASWLIGLWVAAFGAFWLFPHLWIWYYLALITLAGIAAWKSFGPEFLTRGVR
jgi:hypothetical protein